MLVFVDKDKFTLVKGADAQTEYFFNTKTIRHLFCKTCGVQSYGEGVEFPKKAINIRCIDGINLDSYTYMPYNGRDL